MEETTLSGSGLSGGGWSGRAWLMAAELAARLSERARTDWSTEASKAADLATRIADSVYDERSGAPLVRLFEDLEKVFDSVEPNWAAFIFDEEDDDRAQRELFLALRAHVFPEGKPTDLGTAA